MRKFFAALAAAAAVLYPAAIFLCLVVFRAPVRAVSLVMISVGMSAFLALSGGKKPSVAGGAPCAFLAAAGFLCFFTKNALFFKLYSAFLSVLLLFSFGTTLFFEPSMAFRFASMADKSIRGSAKEGRVKAYCRKVTAAWCVFFALNAAISAATAFCAQIFPNVGEKKAALVWSVYNGGISYALTGIMFLAELAVRKKVNARIEKEAAE